MIRHTMAALAAILTAGSAQAAGERTLTAVNDVQLGLKITYSVGVDVTRFVAVMPKGWGFQVLVDGNQDGKWGTAAYQETGQSLPRITADFSYGVDSDSYFCSQYIMGWNADDPSIAQVMTDCDGRPSKGFFQASAADSKKLVTTTYVVPTAELFGSAKDANLELEVWGNKNHHYYFSPSAPLVIRR